VSYSLSDVARVPRLVTHTLVDGQRDAADAAVDALKLAEAVRKQGQLLLENLLRDGKLNAIRRQAFKQDIREALRWHTTTG
jgi:hypothetical protein